MRLNHLILCMVFFCPAVLFAVSMDVINPGFEELNLGKISGDFGLIPGWSQDSSSDSGVEPEGAYTGVYRGFGKASDGPIYQLLGDPFAADTDF